ncbi:MAG: hypothetical protein HZB76_02410 [Chlamydiae bacterium]|nr:hypothetical protein [Chlamydiota bacterium]
MGNGPDQVFRQLDDQVIYDHLSGKMVPGKKYPATIGVYPHPLSGCL